MKTTKSTFNVYFYIKKSNESHGIIICRITVNGKLATFSTRESVDPKRWDGDIQRTAGKTDQERKTNRILDSFEDNITKMYEEKVKRLEPVSAILLKNELFSIDDRKMAILDHWDEFNKTYALKVPKYYSKAQLDRYIKTRKRLGDFIKLKFHTNDYPLTLITTGFIKDFYDYLILTYKLHINTVAKHMQVFHTVFSQAIDHGWVQHDPFRPFKCPTQKPDRGFLTKHEINLILNKQMTSERLEHIKDVFLFSCFTGFAYIDVKQLTPKNIVDGPDGRPWIFTARQKTDVPVYVPLLDVALKLIQKYKAYQDETGKLFPMPSNQKVNDYLKEIAGICGISKNISFHLARHTFATTITLENGVPLETVSKMLGHTDIKTTMIYARVIKEKIANEMGILANKIDGAYNAAAI